jgi:hypothetical protein
MATGFYKSPFYPVTGSDSGGSTPLLFRINSFSNNRNQNEVGTIVRDITFNFTYINGSPTNHSISPLVGTMSNSAVSHTLTNAAITSDVVFTLSATDGTTPRSATTHVRFFYPIYWGKVSNTQDIVQADIEGLNKRISDYTNFPVSLNLADEHSIFVSPMTNPIRDIRETLFGLSIWDTYTIIDNFQFTLQDNTIVPMRLCVKTMPEHTLGQSFNLNILF